jgi:hypothetical protein
VIFRAPAAFYSTIHPLPQHFFSLQPAVGKVLIDVLNRILLGYVSHRGSQPAFPEFLGKSQK